MKSLGVCFLMLFNFNVFDVWGQDMVQDRSQVIEQERWNVEALYSSVSDWKKDFDAVKGQKDFPRWPKLKAFEGKLKDSPEEVAQFLDAYLSLERKLSKLHVYAHLRYDEDLANDENKKNFGLISSLVHDFQLEYSWVEPELLSFNEKSFQRLLTNTKLKTYQFFLEKIARMRPHVLSKENEALIALSSKSLETASKSFGALNNADMTFAAVETQTGEKRELTTGTYLLYMRDPDRVLRKNAFTNLHQAYGAHINTLCELLQGQVQATLYLAKAKKFNSCREAALFSDHVDLAVYDSLIQTIHENLPALHEYIRFRKELMKVDELHPYDLYVPIVEEAEMKTTYADACREVVQSVDVLGKSYQEALQKGLQVDRWVDPFENQHKRSGAYSSGCYDSMPYILMNYHGTLNDILTLAHEAGHSMHSLLSRKNQPYVYAEYPIFVAEVASTFNEQLLLKYLKEKAKSKKELAYLIQFQLEGIRATIFRQTMFAEFELKVHELVEKGETLTPNLLNEIYLELNRTYYGPELVLDSGIEYEWARIPHFYSDFYVYQYATGLSASLALFELVNQSSANRDRYLQFLSSGGSRYPLDLLQIAGVDLRSPAPVKAAMKRFNGLLQELKESLK